MTTLSNKEGRTIQISYDKAPITDYVLETGRPMYIVNIPEIACSDKTDAKYLNEQIRRAIMNIAHNTLEYHTEENDYGY